MKEKKNMLISLDAEKALDKIHPFVKEVLEESGIQNTYQYIIKAISRK